MLKRASSPPITTAQHSTYKNDPLNEQQSKQSLPGIVFVGRILRTRILATTSRKILIGHDVIHIGSTQLLWREAVHPRLPTTTGIRADRETVDASNHQDSAAGLNSHGLLVLV
jgi:hypothetical protein